MISSPNSKPKNKTERQNKMNQLDYKILKSMEIRGGSFASALAQAAYRADDVNLAKIKKAFEEIWQDHLELIEIKQKEEK